MRFNSLGFGNAVSMKRLAVVLLPAVSVFTLPASVHAADPTIMAVGDSITAGFEQPSYRHALYKDLQKSGCSVDMVGGETLNTYSYNNPGLFPGQEFFDLQAIDPRYPAGSSWAASNDSDDTDHQAFGGIRADELFTGIADKGVPDIATQVIAFQPDYMLLHAGTNDLGQEVDRDKTVERWTSQTTEDLRNIIQATRRNQRNVKILVANFIPRDDDEGEFDAREQEMSDALTKSIEDNLSSEANVTIVDVKTGFDTQTMTTDGIHPNIVGEQHMADAFRTELLRLGLCEGVEGNTNTLPTLTLSNRQWEMITIPADPGPNGTVRNLFADDIQAAYGATEDWVVYRYEPSTDQYVVMGLDDTLLPNTGYWIIQVIADSITVDLPDTLSPIAASDVAGCPAGKQCTTASLASSADIVQWSLVGLSTLDKVSYADTRYQTANPACASGCTAAQAEQNNLVSSAAYRWNQTGYVAMAASDQIQPWDGVWLKVLPGANAPVWVLPITGSTAGVQ